MIRRFFTLTLLACTLTATVHADYRDSYRKAIQARNRGRWAEAAQFLQKAIAEESRETGERINISGMDFEPYLPYYYLGLALAKSGDCVGALGSWEKSEAQGTVKRLPEGANLLRYRKECETKVAAARPTPPPPPSPGKPGGDKPAPAAPIPPPAPAGPDPAAVNAAIANATATFAKAEEAAKAVTAFETDPVLAPVWKTEAALGPADQSARNALNGARADFEAGRKDSNLQRLQQSAAAATSAAQQFDAIRKVAGARRDELQRIAATAPRPLPPAAPPVVRSVTPPDVNPKVVKSVDTVTPPAPTPTFTPSPALLGAARLFFSSRYQEASESLGRLRFTSGPAAAHTALLRAATYYSLYLVGGEKDARLLEQARRQVLECRRLGPGLQPDPQAFSPRFVQYFATVK